MSKNIARVSSGMKLAAALVVGVLAFASAQIANGQANLGGPPPLPDLTGIVVDTNWAKILGKAFFWDQRVGSQGQACASCHFSAGAEGRIRNALNPGADVHPVDNTFGNTIAQAPYVLGDTGSDYNVSANGTGTYVAQPSDFPFHLLADITNRNSATLRDTDDVMGSSGDYQANFNGLPLTGDNDDCSLASNGVFHTPSGLVSRQTEARATPSTINAVYNPRNFWDARANMVFNGKNAFGWRDIDNDPTARIITFNFPSNGPQLVPFTIPTIPGVLAGQTASLASQAMLPPVNSIEMSCTNRIFQQIGRKLISSILRPSQILHPLHTQTIDPNDSLFGVNGPKGDQRLLGGQQPGLQLFYQQLIQKAFAPQYWQANGTYTITSTGSLVSDPNGYSQMEQNFSMFWGIAIMLYESTLISDQSQFDTFNAAISGVNASGQPIFGPFGQPNAPGCMVPGFGGGCDVRGDTGVTKAGMTEQQQDGNFLFNNGPQLDIFGPPNPNAVGADCGFCHNGRLFAIGAGAAAADTFQAPTPIIITGQVDPSTGGSSCIAHDFDSFGVGTRPAVEDVGVGGTDPYGNPLSFSRQWKNWLLAGSPAITPANLSTFFPDHIDMSGNSPGPGVTTNPNTGLPQITIGEFLGPCNFNPDFSLAAFPLSPASINRVESDAVFKVPQLRNVALKPPYFHYHGYANLQQLVQFYARGGNRRDMSLTVSGATGDDTGTGPYGDGIDANGSIVPDPNGNYGTNTDNAVHPLNLVLGGTSKTGQVKDQAYGEAALVAYLKMLTDPRVQCDAAPFDHPSLVIHNGHLNTEIGSINGQTANTGNQGRSAGDIDFTLPATGASGYPSGSQYCLPNAGDVFAQGMGGRVGDTAAQRPDPNTN